MRPNSNVIHPLRNIGYDSVNTGGACTFDVTLPIRCIHTYQYVLVVERLHKASGDGVVTETDVRGAVFHRADDRGPRQPAEEQHDRGLCIDRSYNPQLF